MARDAEELAFKEKRMRRIYTEAGGVDVPEIADKAMGARRSSMGSTAGRTIILWDPTVGAGRWCATPACSP